MTATQEMLPSAVTDVSTVPLGDPLEVTGDDYARIMRRVGVDEGEPGTTVSAFNSSI